MNRSPQLKSKCPLNKLSHSERVCFVWKRKHVHVFVQCVSVSPAAYLKLTEVFGCKFRNASAHQTCAARSSPLLEGGGSCQRQLLLAHVTSHFWLNCSHFSCLCRMNPDTTAYWCRFVKNNNVSARKT